MLMYYLLTLKYPTIKIGYLDKSFLDSFPLYIKYFLSLLLNNNPKLRPSFSTIVELFESGIVIPSIINNEIELSYYKNYIQLFTNPILFNYDFIKSKHRNMKESLQKRNISIIILSYMEEFYDDVIAAREIGKFLYLSSDNDAFKYLQKAVTQNDDEALFYTALCYYNGYGCKKNKQKALKIITNLSKSGHKESIEYLQKKEKLKIINRMSIKNIPNIWVIGKWFVGKTSFVYKLIDIYSPLNSPTTIFYDRYPLYFKDDEQNEYCSMIYDVQDLEQMPYRFIKEPMHNADLIVVLFSVNDENSLKDIEYYLGPIMKDIPFAKFIFIGNKIDLEKEIKTSKILKIIEEFNAKYIEVSCYTGENIKTALKIISKEAKESYDSKQLGNKNV